MSLTVKPDYPPNVRYLSAMWCAMWCWMVAGCRMPACVWECVFVSRYLFSSQFLLVFFVFLLPSGSSFQDGPMGFLAGPPPLQFLLGDNGRSLSRVYGDICVYVCVSTCLCACGDEEGGIYWGRRLPFRKLQIYSSSERPSCVLPCVCLCI